MVRIGFSPKKTRPVLSAFGLDLLSLTREMLFVKELTH